MYATGVDDPSLRAWDTNTGEPVATRATADGGLWDVLASRDGKTVVTNAPGVLRVWDAATLTERRAIRYPGGQYGKAWLSADGGKVAVSLAGDAGVVRVYDTSTGAEDAAHTLPKGELGWAAGFPGGKLRVVTADPNRVLRLRDPGTDAPPVILAGVTLPAADRAFKQGLFPVTVDLSPDGKRVVVGSSASVSPPATVWDADTGKAHPLPTLRGACWFTPDGSGVVCAGLDRLVKVVDAATGAERGVYPGSAESLRFAVVSPDGRQVAAAGGQGQPLRVWDADRPAGPVAFPRPVPMQGVGRPVAFSPDRTRMLGIDDDGVREWDTATGKEARVLARGPADTIAYSPDGRRAVVTARVASDASAAAVRVYDLASGNLAVEVPTFGRSGGGYGFTADSAGLYLHDAGGRSGSGTWRAGSGRGPSRGWAKCSRPPPTAGGCWSGPGTAGPP